MSVYVDDARNEFGRMKMCHMLADTTDELVVMADRIGVKRKWIQFPGTYREHFDIALSKRQLAIRHGAQEVSTEFLVDFRNRKRGVVSQFSGLRRDDAEHPTAVAQLNVAELGAVLRMVADDIEGRTVDAFQASGTYAYRGREVVVVWQYALEADRGATISIGIGPTKRMVEEGMAFSVLRPNDSKEKGDG